MKAQINIILLGRSGAGKSSLANYLYQQEVFKTSTSERGTPSNKIQKASIEQEDYVINIYDTAGIEPDNHEEWENVIKNFIEGQCGFEAGLSQWIHGAFYVINAATTRVEPAELKIIREFPAKYHFPISVVLTNCDAVSQKALATLTATLKKELPDIKIFKVCSVKRTTIGGKKIEPFSREELLSSHADNVAFYFEQRIGVQFFKIIVPKVTERFTSEMRIKIKDTDIFPIIKAYIFSETDLISPEEFEMKFMRSSEVLELEEFKNFIANYVMVFGNKIYKFENPALKMDNPNFLKYFAAHINKFPIFHDAVEKFKACLISANLKSYGPDRDKEEDDIWRFIYELLMKGTPVIGTISTIFTAYEIITIKKQIFKALKDFSSDVQKESNIHLEDYIDKLTYPGKYLDTQISWQIN